MSQSQPNSIAIIEWLEDEYSNNSLLPKNPLERAAVRELAMIVAAGTQPIQNLKVMQYVSDDKADREKWAQHFIKNGLRAFESRLQALGCSGEFCYGDQLTLADLCLIPQVYNAKRFNIDLSEYPLIEAINERALKLPSCIKAHPDRYAPTT